MEVPRLIVFEGVDAAGKSTMRGQYIKELVNHGVDTRLLSFPRMSPGTLGAMVYQLYHDPQATRRH